MHTQAPSAPNQPTHLVVHCSDADWGTPKSIASWHTTAPPNGNGWSHIGYHFVVENGRANSHDYDALADGRVTATLPLEQRGIHTPALNACSIAVCLVGKTGFTVLQKQALVRLLTGLSAMYNIPVSRIIGHRESPTETAKGAGAKTCPNMSPDSIRAAVAEMLDCARGASGRIMFDDCKLL